MFFLKISCHIFTSGVFSFSIFFLPLWMLSDFHFGSLRPLTKKICYSGTVSWMIDPFLLQESHKWGGGERKAMIWCIHCPRQCAGQYCQILFSFSFFISPLKWTLIVYLFSICVDASSLTVAVLELGYNSSIWK